MANNGSNKGVFEMSNITIYDVAREAGVSMATVSRVVNGNPNVKPVTRKKVLDVIERLGYRPNAVARGLASKKTTTVGVIIPDISHVFYAELARGIEDIATMYKYNIILSNSDQTREREFSLINTMLGKQVDGLIFISENVTETHVEEFKRARIPVVLASSIDKNKEIPSVTIDYHQATFDAISYFIEKGHKRIAMLKGPDNTAGISQKKIEGYQEALKAGNIPFDENLIISSEYSHEDGIEAFMELWNLDEKPTAILCTSDELALACINAASDNGVKVPDEIEIIGFNDTKLAKMVRPTLTTVVQPTYDIGAVAMRLLTKYMNKEEVEEDNIVLPHHIIFRGSTKE